MPDERRTTKDLIAELDANAEGYKLALLIVGFEHTTVFIRSTHLYRLKALNDAVQNGEEPIGWARALDGSDSTRIEFGLLTEYQNEPWAKDYLAVLRGSVEAAIPGAQ